MKNHMLKPFASLIGEWKTIGTHPAVSGEIHGRASFEWLEDGAFVIMHSEIIDDTRFPKGVAIFGSDDEAQTYYMIYFDERGVSRTYDVSFRDGVLEWRRDSPKLSQRVTLEVADGSQTIASKGEMSQNGSLWGPDLSLTYTRVA